MNFDLSDPLVCCRLICVFYGVSSLITFLEKLVLYREYGSGGWHAWEVFRFDRTEVLGFRTFPNLADAVFGSRGIATISAVGTLGVGFMWLSPVRSNPFFAGILLTFCSAFLLNVRDVYGGDGAQQMSTLVGAAVLFGFNPWVSENVESIALLFIAAQSCLAYCTSGVAKLVSPAWMKGDALMQIFSTKSYGSAFAFRQLSRMPTMSRSAGRVAVFVEVVFPLAMLGPRWVLGAALLWGVGFHLLNALLMGLNTFFWSFLATYPALCFTWIILHDAIHAAWS
jgi:hypothetical protein